MTPEEPEHILRNEEDWQPVFESVHEFVDYHHDWYRYYDGDILKDNLRQAHIDIPINLDDLINSLLNE